MPFASVDGIAFYDALFTSTSAVCVTGLIVLDTGKDFTFAGQLVILTLIQIGGLGFMTMANWFLLSLRRKTGLLGNYYMIEQSFGAISRVNPRVLIKRVFFYTFIVEIVGALILYLRFSSDFESSHALWLAIFHSISAFCNAGFSLFTESLMGYSGDLTINMTILGLIILGGIGFIVFSEVFDFTVRKFQHKPKINMSLHSSVVLKTTFWLIVITSVIIFIFEYINVNSGRGVGESALTSVFQSVTCRTAGFNTVETANLTNASLLIVIFLMVVGGSPGSTAGGIKTSTFAIIICTLKARVFNRKDVEISNRRVPASYVSKAFATMMAYVAVMTISIIILEITEFGFNSHTKSIIDAGGVAREAFLDHLFEVVSALSTVGLSTGVTGTLSSGGMMVIMLCMFIGRLGPLFIAASFVGSRTSLDFSYPEGEVMVG